MLEGLLTYIERYFPYYFNFCEKIPNSYRLILEAEFRLGLAALAASFEGSGIASTLQRIITSPFEAFICRAGPQPVSYSELFYLEALYKEVTAALAVSEKGMEAKSIVDILLYLNFNEPIFIEYCIRMISVTTNEAASLPAKIEQLAWWHKTLSQLQVQPLAAYKCHACSVKEYLKEWITQEMLFF